MSAAGHSGDAAAGEGFFGMLKREQGNRRHSRSLDAVHCDAWDNVARFHNPRVQQSLVAEDQIFSGFALSVRENRVELLCSQFSLAMRSCATQAGPIVA